MPTDDTFSSAAPNVYEDREFNCPAAKITPGQLYVTKREMMIVTVLGSCVSACIRDPLTGIGGMNHFMLPEQGYDPGNRVSPSARYGAYAMEVLINHLLNLGAERSRLVAKVFGAGQVLAGVSDIGKRNADFTLAYLRRENIRVLAEDLGGPHARKVYFFVHTGRVLVKELRRMNNETILLREQRYASQLGAAPVAGEADLF